MPTASAFLAAPRGAYVLGHQFFYFQTTSDVTGYVVWGSPDSEDIDDLETLIAGSVARLSTHTSLVDARAIEGAPPLLFDRLATFVRDHHEALSSSLSRLALVRGRGITGATAAGFFDVVDPPYPVRSFDELVAALEWLGVEDAPELAAEIEDIRDGASKVAPILRQLRSLVSASLPQPDEDAIARALGLSSRTLQRRMAELGTTFASEVSHVRVSRAVTLLETTDDPLTRIAFDIGCPSLSSFSTLVRKMTGATPSEIRARKRTG
jgi:AraC-like DNA-binding protein